MTIHETQITEKQIEACLARMREGTFKQTDITAAALKAGVPNQVGYNSIAMRCANTIIQRERKAGTIKLERGMRWTWVGKKA